MHNWRMTPGPARHQSCSGIRSATSTCGRSATAPSRSDCVGEAVNRYVNEWITRLVDVTESAQSIHACLLERGRALAAGLLPPEREYPFEKIAPGLFGA